MTAENRPSNGSARSIPQTFLENGDAATALAARTAQVDQDVLRAAAELLLPGTFAGIAVLAVGGYGRRQLFPYSDVDLLLLFATEKAAVAHKESVSAFLQRLWDSGLRLGHSVRTPDECLAVHDQNAELNVSLLDQRFLTGDRTLYASLVERLPRFLHGNRDALVRNLAKLTRERHAKFGDTFYHLEPNVKETPGGLRDYQLICWLQQLRETDALHLAQADPDPQLQQGFRFLTRLRCYLHCQSGRDNNLLSFDSQDAIAELWYHLPHPGEEAAAQWMREYYRHARAIYRAATRQLDASESPSSALLAQFRDWRSRLSNGEFSVHRERAQFRAPQQLESDPDLVLRLFEFVARHGIRPSLEAEERIQAHSEKLRAHFAGSPQPLWPAMQQILSLPHAPLALRSMHETGVLAALFPELRQVECLVVRDFFHRYTVDEHTLVAIQCVCALRDGGDPTRKFYSDLLAEVQTRAVLLFALLFHDSGKGSAGEGHVDASARLAEAAMARLRMPAQDRDMVLFLIRRHLELSSVLQSRDVSDPQTIRDAAHRVETVERLKALTLLTYADISAVNPGAMTPWRAEQLLHLYLMVYNELTRELESERIEALPSGPPERVQFLEGFPTRYLRTHSDAEIDAHMALKARSREHGLAVDIRRLEAAWQLTLVTRDKTGLFASVAGTLSSFGLNILKAEAFSNRRGLVLDSFTFADPLRNLELNESEADRLRGMVERVIAGKADVRQLLKNRPKPAPPSRRARIPARVTFNSEASGGATLIEIVAEDRPGLLYDLASAISALGGNIEVVLIDTEAHKAMDVFYVTAEGRKLEPAKQEAMTEALEKAAGAG